MSWAALREPADEHNAPDGEWSRPLRRTLREPPRRALDKGVGRGPILTHVSRSIDRIVDRITHSYASIGGINHISGPNLPSMESVIKIIADFESLIFPGYKSGDLLRETNLRYVTGETVNRLVRALQSEIFKSLCFKRRLEDPDSGGYCQEAEAARLEAMDQAEILTFEILDCIPEIRRRIKLDVEAAFEGDPAARSRDEVILAYPGIEALLIHRVAHDIWLRHVPLIPRMMSEHIHGKTGIDIHPGAQIGDYFFIDHATGVVIGETTTIGNHVKVYQGVTIGALSVSKRQVDTKRHPTIEDDVTIYAGATILGGDTTIGKGSIIGGNVWITESVPPGSKIYNPPATYIRK